MRSIKSLGIIIVVLLFFSVLFPTSVYGIDFDFSIPIELKNIPAALKYWKLIVQVYDAKGGKIAHAEKMFSINKNFSTTMRVQFVVQSGKNKNAATHYFLILQVKDPKTGRYTWPATVMKPSGPYPYDSSKPFTPQSGIKRKIK